WTGIGEVRLGSWGTAPCRRSRAALLVFGTGRTRGDVTVTYEAFVAPGHQFLRCNAAETIQMLDQTLTHTLGHLVVIAVGTTGRFRQHLVNNTELMQTGCGEAHSFRRFRCLVGTAPQNRGTAFGRNHGIGSVLQHLQVIADTNRERATG